MKLNYLKSTLCTILLMVSTSSFIQSQTVYTFTNCGATGRQGPSQTQVNSAYNGTNLSGQVTATNGIQYWQVPATGKYSIEVIGAKGGGVNGGKGARMIGEFQLTASSTLKILVGQQGEELLLNRFDYSGGGGSFVTTTTNVPLVVAGGGGGAYTVGASSNGSTATSGNDGAGGHSNAVGGTGGAGGAYNNQTSDGGAGFTGNGGSGNPSPAPQSFINGGEGGCNSWSSSVCANGGFGGGGGTNRFSTTWWACGGGGGYSGGGAAYGQSTHHPYAGGGGSINNGTNQVNSSGYGTGDGKVIITFFPSKPNDAGVSTLISPSNNCVGTYTVTARIYNGGTNQINNVDVNWTIDGVAQTPYSHTNLLDTSGGTGPNFADINLGSITLTAGITKVLKVWTTNPNGVQDSVNGNDTLIRPLIGYAFPTLNLGSNVTICPEDSATFNGGSGRDSLIWSTTDTSQTIRVNATGWYYVSVYENGCESRDSVLLSHFPGAPVVDFGPDTLICFNDSLVLDATKPGVTYLWQDNSTNPTFTVTQNGNYSVTLEDANSCISTESIRVTFITEPSVSLVVSPSNNICFDVTQRFTAFPSTSGSIDFQWKVNGTNSGGQTTSATFNGPVDNGDTVSVDLITDLCATTPYPVPSNKIGMTVRPPARAINGKLLVQENTTETYLLPLVPTSSYVWRVNGGTINGDSTLNVVRIDWGTANPNASLTLVETDNTNCTRENVINVNVVSIVGIDNITEGFGIGNPYPNPSDDIVNIPIHSVQERNVTVQLFDATGKFIRTIYQGKIYGDTKLTVDVKDLSSGLYYYKLTTPDGFMSVKRLSVER